MKKNQKRYFWENKVKEIKQSGLTVAAWVRKQDEFTIHQARYWIEKFDEEAKLEPEPKAVNQADWLSVDLSPSPSPSPQTVNVHLPNGALVEIPAGLNPVELSNLLRVVKDL